MDERELRENLKRRVQQLRPLVGGKVVDVRVDWAFSNVPGEKWRAPVIEVNREDGSGYIVLLLVDAPGDPFIIEKKRYVDISKEGELSKKDEKPWPERRWTELGADGTYTVVGRWHDSCETWVEHVTARNGWEAAVTAKRNIARLAMGKDKELAIKEIEEQMEWMECIAVFRGKHEDCAGRRGQLMFKTGEH